MKQVNERTKTQLENMLGYKICPFTMTGEASYDFGLFHGEDTLTIFKCVVDGGTAQGGKQSELVPNSALRPCSMDYARGCTLYLTAVKK